MDGWVDEWMLDRWIHTNIEVEKRNKDMKWKDE